MGVSFARALGSEGPGPTGDSPMLIMLLPLLGAVPVPALALALAIEEEEEEPS
jgi:hypothetical protein